MNDALLVIGGRPQAVRAAHQTFGFTRVVSLVDQAMELVGQIDDEFGLPGTSRAVAHRFNDKLAMRAWLRSTGFEDVAAEPAGDAADLAEAFRRLGAAMAAESGPTVREPA